MINLYYLLNIVLLLVSLDVESVHQALISIREADSTNVDTTTLVDRLNYALELMDKSESDVCSTKEECISKAEEILNSIKEEARVLSDSARKYNSMQIYINMLFYAPISALIVSFLFAFGYITLKRYRENKFLEMSAKVKRE